MINKNIAITYLRALAAASIFACHILFISGYFKTSMWLNTGVPLFFLISGFLMSKKNILLTNKGIFCYYGSRIKKLSLPYIVYILAVVVVLCLIQRPPTLSSVIMYLIGCAGFTENGVLGLGHLWFITVLLICYFLTPLLQLLKDSQGKAVHGRGTVALLCFCGIQLIAFIVIEKPSYGIHVISYTIGYVLLGNCERSIDRGTIEHWGVAALVLSIIRLLADTRFMAAEYRVYYYYDALFQPIARLTIAVWIFCVAIFYCGKIQDWAEHYPRLDNMIQTFSAYSFEVYLTHQFIQLAVWEFFPHTNAVGVLVWIFMSAILTALNSWMLRIICEKIIRKRREKW